jgi:hypothetical protein
VLAHRFVVLSRHTEVIPDLVLLLQLDVFGGIHAQRIGSLVKQIKRLPLQPTARQRHPQAAKSAPAPSPAPRNS